MTHRIARKTHEAGMTLITVLAITTLLVIFGLAMVSLSLTENASSKSAADLSTARRLHDTAVNVSLSQLRVGMDQVEGVSGREVWASQPGAIWSWKENGDFLRGIKLYSDDEMVVTAADALVDDPPPVDWSDRLLEFVDLNDPVLRGERAHYPILDPAALYYEVDGFDVDDSAIDGIVASASAPKDLRLPMPVRWLYLLEDGTIGVVDGGGEFFGPQTPTESNPMVGRIAFWIDDESSKINVNTASEPTPWDTPRAINLDDMNYSKAQPSKNEYQRYPGHPATTALSGVLYGERDEALSVKDKEAIYAHIPRVVGGGTTSGTVRSNEILTPDRDRLFATVDEFLFKPDRQLVADPEKMRRLRFFLTANSRSPELNPNGRPKVSLWPIGRAPTYPRTAFDHLSAFCASVGGELYAFQRQTSNHPTRDWDEIERNREVYRYLLREGSANIPGYPESFASKLGADYSGVMTSIFDYVRSTNLREKAISTGNSGTGAVRRFANNGQVTPIRIDNEGETTQGFGRFFTITEYGLHFICNGHGSEGQEPEEEPPLEADEKLVQMAMLFEPFSPSQGWPRLYDDFTVRVEGAEVFSLESTPLEMKDSIRFRPTNLGSSWHGRNWGGPMGIRTFIGNRGEGYPFISRRVRVKGDTMSFEGGLVTVEIFSGNTVNKDRLIQTMSIDFPSGTFPVPDLVKTGTTTFKGGRATNAQFWQHFGGRYSETRRVPHVPGDEYADKKRRWPPDYRGNPGGFKVGGVFRLEDVVRTMVPIHGDHRHIAGKISIPATDFVAGANYHDPAVPIDHLFNDTQGTHLLYGFGNEPGLTSKVNDPNVQLTAARYHYSRLPDVRPGSGQFNLYGDFDNGLAQIHDGAYINRADEGNIQTRGGGDYSYFSWNYKEPTEVNFSPNRMIPSPGMLGSLPTGIARQRPWETLLFRPQEDHPGEENPPDHSLMEYFWMPVIEPYAISEPCSTAGKINLNYRILPFSYIKRSTAVRAVLASERPLAIDNEVSRSYKLWDHETSDQNFMPDTQRGNYDPETREQWIALRDGSIQLRKPIDANLTLAQFEEKFDAFEAFRYPSEICDMHLVREGEELGDYRSGDFYESHLLTGDNTRERPYTNLYPRLTTRSNTFRIHAHVEVLQKAKGGDPAVFNPLTDTVTSTYQGSTLVERFINPNDPTLPDFAELGGKNCTLDDFFQFRILESARFSP